MKNNIKKPLPLYKRHCSENEKKSHRQGENISRTPTICKGFESKMYKEC
jgi:hypothetical protein